MTPTMTTQQVLAAGGVYPLRNGKSVWSADAFRRQFKVGDLIQYGPSVNATGRITAIGEKRFLFKVTRWNGHFEERVGTIRSAHGWAPVPECGAV